MAGEGEVTYRLAARYRIALIVIQGIIPAILALPDPVVRERDSARAT